ncbi:MAG: tetratricopeptide repeat protein, partial [Alphaproteobacteria bacterium]
MNLLSFWRPPVVESLYLKGSALHRQGESRAAARLYKRAIQRAKRVPAIWQTEYLEVLGERRVRAIPILQKIAMADSKTGLTRYLLAGLLEEAGRQKEAVKMYGEAMLRDPNPAWCGDFVCALGRLPDDALNDLYISIGVNHAEPLTKQFIEHELAQLGITLLSRQQMTSWLALNLAKLYRSINDFSAATDFYCVALCKRAAEPGISVPESWQADYLYLLGDRRTDAIPVFQAIVANDEKAGLARHLLA